MPGGYVGKILRVDLTRQKFTEDQFSEEVLRTYIGGAGIGAKILFDETGVETEPLGEDNVLIIMTGPLTGTKALNSGRAEVVTLSPLTNIYAESNVGGSWGPALKKAGFDGVILYGKAPRPVYIWINNGEVEIRDAQHVWGKDTFECDEILKSETHKKAVSLNIGPAGEQLVKIAAIMTDGVDGRAAARCGVGAVMGSKNLKAILAHGDLEIPVYDKERLMQSVKPLAKTCAAGAEGMRLFGSAVGLMTTEAIGDLPIKNWYLGNFEGAEKISGQAVSDTILVKPYFCSGCVIGCGRTVHVKEGKYASIETGGPEYETLSTLGSMMMIDDLEAIQLANELCNRYGLDTISAGGVIGFAMEAYEKGIITKDDTEGIDLTWGNPDAMLEVLKQIGENRGIGKVLGQGVLNAANIFGKNSIEFAVHCKGLEFAGHDPRAKMTSGLGYATSPVGGSHMTTFAYEFESGAPFPDAGYPVSPDRLEVNGKSQMTVTFQHIMSMFDSLSLCKFILFGAIGITDMVEWLRAVTGWEDYSNEEFLKTGERMYNLKRLYNNRLGLSRKDDVLPPRMLTHKRGTGGSAEVLPPLGEMLSDYYSLRGWTEDGIPTNSKLEELGLDHLRTT